MFKEMFARHSNDDDIAPSELIAHPLPVMRPLLSDRFDAVREA